jgi:hypothetical protein
MNGALECLGNVEDGLSGSAGEEAIQQGWLWFALAEWEARWFVVGVVRATLVATAVARAFSGARAFND